MSEPWMSPEAGVGDDALCARFVCRVSGAPAGTVDALRAPRTLERVERLLEAEARLAGERERVSDLLFHAIGAAPDKPARNRLIALKRELYNLRPVPAAKVDEAAASLDAAAAAEVRAFQAALEARGAAEAELRAGLAEETAEARGRFRALLDDADFRKGLMISSRALYGALPRYAAKAELSGKEEKTERGLLRYYTRAAAKATPFSTFCAILPGRFVEPGAAEGAPVFRFHGDPRSKRSYVRINKFIYGLLLDHLKERPTVRRRLQVELNPTLRNESGRLVYLTALQSREVFQRLADNDVLQLITERIQGGKPTLGDLIAALSSDPQIDATPEEAEAYLDKLIEIGFLRFHTGIREQEAEWDLPLRALLDGIDDDHARQSSELLARLREATEAYTDADVEGRAKLIEEMHALLGGAIERMEVQARLRKDMPFYEDATAGASAEVALTPAVRRPFDAFAEWVRLTSRLAWPRGEMATMRHFYDTFYGASRPVPLLVFYEDFYREHFKAHVEKEAKMRAGVRDAELKDYNVNNPFGLDFVKALGEARDRLTTKVVERWRAAPEAEEIVLTAAEVEEALRGVENTSAVARSMGTFGVLVPPAKEGEEAKLVLQGGSYTAGYGKYFSRFLYMLPDDMQEDVRRWNAGLTDELLAEICGDAQFNANLHPPLMKWEISYPTGESGNAEQQLRSSDIFVEADPDDPNALLLRHGPTGQRVIPVDLGFLNPRMRPPLYQLVSRFTPAMAFAPPLPESPETRKPAPAAAPAEGAGEAAPLAAAAADAAPVPGADGGIAEGAPVAQPAPPEPKIGVRPRVSFEGGLVLARRRWLVPSALFPQRGADESAADFFLRVQRWRAAQGIPESVYVRINPLPEPQPRKEGEASPAEGEAEAAPAAEAEVPGYGAPEAHEEAEEPAEEAAPAAEGAAAGEGDAAKKPAAPRTAVSRDFHKPQFMDFGSPLLVGLLGKMAATLKSYQVTIEERLPGRESLPEHGGDAYASELVVQLYFPAGLAGPAHALSGEEDHAAVA